MKLKICVPYPSFILNEICEIYNFVLVYLDANIIHNTFSWIYSERAEVPQQLKLYFFSNAFRIKKFLLNFIQISELFAIHLKSKINR